MASKENISVLVVKKNSISHLKIKSNKYLVKSINEKLISVEYQSIVKV